MLCYGDFRSHLKANCLLLPFLSSLLAMNSKSAFSLQRIFRCQIFPCENWPVVEFGVLVFAVLFNLHEKSFEIHR